MAALTLQHITDAGTAPNLSGAASTSDTALVGNGLNTFLVYKNSNGASRTVTLVVTGNTEYGEPMPDKVITVPATNGEKWIPLRKVYGGDTGSVTITCPDATGLTVALVRLG